MDSSTDSRYVYGPNVVLGLGITALGIALLLDRLGIVRAWELLQFWPGLLVIFGGSIVWHAVRGRTEGVGRDRLLISPGLVMLFVVAGFVASRADFREPNRVVTSTGDTAGVHAILGQSRQTSIATHFRGANMTSVMGGSTLDLRQTTVADGEEVVIEVFGLMGGIDLFVPKHWVVVSDVVPVMGQVDDRRNRPASDSRAGRWDDDQPVVPPTTKAPGPQAPSSTATDPTASANPPRLVIRGFIMMGGLDIRS